MASPDIEPVNLFARMQAGPRSGTDKSDASTNWRIIYVHLACRSGASPALGIPPVLDGAASRHPIKHRANTCVHCDEVEVE